MVPTTAPDPPQVGGVKAAQETGKQRPKRNVGTLVRRATKRASVGRSAPIRTNTDPVEPHYAEGSEGPKTGKGSSFVMNPKANSMKKIISKPNEVWYVDSRASNDMMNHEEWFSYLEKLEQLRVVKLATTPHI